MNITPTTPNADSFDYFEKATAFSKYLKDLGVRLKEANAGEITYVADTPEDAQKFNEKVRLIKVLQQPNSEEYFTLKSQYETKVGRTLSVQDFNAEVNADIVTLDHYFQQAREDGKMGVANVICGIQIKKTYDSQERLIVEIREQANKLGLEIETESIEELDTDEVINDFWFYIVNVKASDGAGSN